LCGVTDNLLNTKKEIDFLKQLQCPYIIKYVESFSLDEQTFCIVMEKAATSLRSLILKKKKNKEKFSEDEALKYFSQIV